jgi:hypothetical protein
MSEIALFPNPAVDMVQIKVADWGKVERVKVVNAAGKTVYESNYSQLSYISSNGIQVKDFPVGLYFVKIQGKDGFVHSLKMMKY